jgi:hypothetical protein
MIKSKRMRWVGHAVCMGELRDVYKILIGKPEGKRPLRRPRHKWENNNKMDPSERRLEGVDRLHLIQVRDQ